MRTKLFLLAILSSIFFTRTGIKAQIFERVKCDAFNKVTVVTDGVAWIDYNDDGKPDIYRTDFANSGCTLFENKGDGTFSFVKNSVITPGKSDSYSGISWGDYDNDGNADIFISSLSGAHALYKNLGKGKFVRITDSRVTQDQIISLQSTWIDYDNDGWLDLFVPTAPNLGFYAQTGVTSLLYHNNGDGSFTRIKDGPVATDLGSHSCAAFADMDNDGDQDLFSPEWGNYSFLYENNGDGTFKKITGSAVNTNSNMSISCSWADYDNDGYMDLYVGNGSTSDSEKQLCHLFHNNGNKTFTKVNAGELTSYKSCTWSEAWGDVDNDGDLDIVLGTIYETNQLFLNNGDGTFTNAHEFASEVNGTAGVCFGDYDNDGSLDMAIGYVGNDLSQVLFHNKGNSNHWLLVNCKGVLSNRSAIGARVKVKAIIGGKSIWQTREVNGNQGHRCSNDLRAHFGLGNSTVIDSLMILWPSGQKTIMKDIKVDTLMNITESIPDSYLAPNFIADTLKGKDSLKVTFSDISIVDPNNPVISYKWDFNGDGVIDSEEKNPNYTFYVVGYESRYNISLTIISAKDTSTLVKKDFITVKKSICKECHNVAKFRKAYASSLEAGGLAAPKAIDGSIDTRWSSSFSDPQWIMVNLTYIDTIEGIVLKWEAAAAQEYRIKVSEDSINWKEIYHTEKCLGGDEELSFAPIKAKYVKMEGVTRKSPYGYSLYEFEIYGHGEELSELKNNNIENNIIKGMPNPFKNQVEIKYKLNNSSDVELEIYNLSGQRMNKVSFRQLPAGEHSYKWNGKNKAGSDLPNGVYFCKLYIKNGEKSFSETAKLLKIK